MITKQDISRWYDEGQKPLTAEQKQDLKDLVKSWNKLGEIIKRIKFDKIQYPKMWKEKGINEWLEIITGKSYEPVNKEWQDLRIK